MIYSKVFVMFMMLLFATNITETGVVQTVDVLLYRYSNELSAFVIENGNGTEQTILAHFDLPDDFAIVGPGWSQSGQWFSWYGVSYSGSLSTNGFVVDRDGTTVIELPVEGRMQNILWSPVEDLLLVAEFDDETGSITTRIIDVDNDMQVIATADLATGYWYTEWIPDGSAIAIYHSVGFGIDSTEHMLLLSTNGDIEERTILLDRSVLCPLPQWSLDGKAAYVDAEEQLIVEDLSSGNLVAFDIDGGRPHSIDWSPNSDLVIVYTADDCFSQLGQAWLLSLSQHTISRFSDPVRIPLPAYRNLIAARDPRYFRTSVWSPQGTHAVIVDDQNRLHIVNADTGQNLAIEFPISGSVGDFWWNTNNQGIIVELAVPQNDTDMLFNIQLNDEDTIHVQQVLSEDTKYDVYMIAISAISPNWQYIAHSGLGCTDICINNLETGHKFAEMSFAQSEEYNIFIREILWHPDQPWIMAASELDGLRLINIMRIDDDVQRSLEICSLSLSCFGWLPERGE